MWALYRRKKGDDEGIFDYDGEKLDPLRFSNGKNQADVVKEVFDLIEKGHKIIFIKGVCGTGKSAIALNLARHFNKTSIVVPIKSLQEQYEKDYTNKNFVLKKDNKKMKISVIKGRNNFRCPFTMGESADSPDLPCTIELRDKNMEKIKEFIGLNSDVEKTDFSSISDVRRMSVAPACPYWSPVLPADLNPKSLEDVKKIKYLSVCGKEFALFQRKKGCEYCDQYVNYAESDVLIFNSMKYLIETAIGRKPKSDLEIIDECDEFLDSFATEKRLNLNRLVMALSGIFPSNSEEKNAIKEIISLTNEILFSEHDEEIRRIEKTKVLDLIEAIMDNPYLAEDEENNYYNYAFETVKEFEHLLKETYYSYDVVEGDKQKGLFGENFIKNSDQVVLLNLVSINLAQKFKDIVDANNVLVLMSGTLHSEEVLKDIFGLENFKVVEAEIEMPGEIKKCWTGMERACSFANFQKEIVTRKHYLKAMDVCMANAESPTLVHVSAFKDLPSEEENAEYKFDNLITQEKLKELQNGDRDNRLVEDFLAGGENVLFTTKCSRGVDFAGDKCKSIVVTKYPYPNIQGLFWKILKKEQPDKFMEFYVDKARRELIQKVARGVRFKGDKVTLFSPDSRVLNEKFD